MQRVEQWDIFELSLSGPDDGNPFVDVELFATFTQGDQFHRIRGFYDGDGVYRLRFMPDAPGEWEYRTESNRGALDCHHGSLICDAATGDNHGPVRVANTFHFAYDDGTPYRPIGTTCYAWTHQGDELEAQTLETLASSPFNKIRMCVFPKSYAFNSVEPPRYPFVGTPPKTWDTTRFNPDYFRHFETRVGQLRKLGIEADVILFHPYDDGRWGFDRMDADSNDRYLRYVIARLAAYRNVWWSLANEFDFIKEKQPADWDRFFQIVTAEDPYGHLRSIHNAFRIYDHNQPWPTHVSLQNGSAVADFGRAGLYRDVYNKPIVLDEVKYEGNLPQRWGCLSAEEMVHRMWQGAIAGTYAQHGETYLHPGQVIWWARGGKLHGQSPARIAFLRQILESAPSQGIDPIDKWQDLKTAGVAGQYYLVYFGRESPADWRFELPRAGIGAEMRFRVEVIDTWSMTIEPVDGEFEVIEDATYRYGSKGDRTIALPGRPFMALRITRTGGDVKVTEKKIYGEG
jgi:hypothetical protein